MSLHFIVILIGSDSITIKDVFSLHKPVPTPQDTVILHGMSPSVTLKRLLTVRISDLSLRVKGYRGLWISQKVPFA